MLGFVLLITMLVQQQSSTIESTQYFDKLFFFPKNEKLNNYVDAATTNQLKLFAEPSLRDLARRDRSTIAYRFLWLSSNRPPTCIRVNKSANTYVMHIVRHDGPGGGTKGMGKIILREKIVLDQKQWLELHDRFEGSNFWSAATEVTNTSGIADGDAIILEGVNDGRYKLIHRVPQRMGERYKDICRLFLVLASSDLLKTWDSLRKVERRLDNYQEEPKEIEELGDFKNRKKEEFDDGKKGE